MSDKGDLRELLITGCTVELRNKEHYMVVRGCNTKKYGRQDFCLIKKNGFLIGSNYNEELYAYDVEHSDRCYEFDIMKIYANTNINGNTYSMEVSEVELAWERYERVVDKLFASDLFWYSEDGRTPIVCLDEQWKKTMLDVGRKRGYEPHILTVNEFRELGADAPDKIIVAGIDTILKYNLGDKITNIKVATIDSSEVID